MSSSHAGIRRKTPNACRRCRARKVKCSGQQPCEFCTSKNLQCNFEVKEKTVTVPQAFIDSLQNRISTLEARLSAGPTSSPELHPRFTLSGHIGEEEAAISANGDSERMRAPIGEPSGTRDIGNSQGHVADETMTNSLTSYTSPIMVIEHGQHRCLGHSSNWSLNQRLREMIGSSCGDTSARTEIPTTDGMTYKIPLQPNAIDLSDINLPSTEYAEYLTNTVSFHLGSLYFLFDKESFVYNLKQFYAPNESSIPKKHHTGLWGVQMLMIFAFGEALLKRESSPSGPAGSQFFLRALDSLPNIHALYFQPILAIEVLCLVSLFAQAADMKSTSYCYIGVALRIAVSQGINRELSKCSTASDVRCRDRNYKLWWTVYSIDRRLAAIMGLMPTSCGGTMPELGDVPNSFNLASQDRALKFHVVLSSNLGNILNVVYGLQGELGAKFVARVQSVLSELSCTSKLLCEVFPIDTACLDGANYRVAASLHLLSHQCATLAIRPVLFSIVEKKLVSRETLTLSDAVKALLRMGIESSINCLKILESLRSQHLLDILFLFDLDSTLSAAFLLLMVDIINPSRPEFPWGLQTSISLFDSFQARGNVPSSHYKKTLLDLVDLRSKIQTEHGNDALELVAAPTNEMGDINMNIHCDHQQESSSTAQQKALPWNENDHSDLYGLDLDILQCAIDGLDFGFNPGTSLDIGEEWLWRDSIVTD